MNTVINMSVTEAASKALEIILAGRYLERQEYWKNTNSAWYDPDLTWQKHLAEEYDYDAEEDSEEYLDNNTSAWSSVKYEGGKYTIDGLTANVEASYGGEGEGDQYWVVVSISDGLTTRYFKRHGWYASYSGGYLDGPTEEVRPKQKMITVYEDTV